MRREGGRGGGGGGVGVVFFFNDTATTEIYTLSLHDALPIFNKNNAAGFLNLCLAGGIGFLYWSANQKSRSGENLRLEKSDSSTARHTVWGRLTGWIAQLDAIQLTALFCIILIVAGISSTLSRGGFVAMTFGGLA